MAKVIFGVIVAAAIGFLCWTWGLNVLHFFTTSFREGTAFWFFVGLAAIAAIIAFVFTSDDGAAGFFIFSAVVLVAVGVVMGANAEFNLAKQYIASSKIVKSDAPSYAERAPYEVALTAASNMQDTTGEAGLTKSLVDQREHGEWNTLVYTRGPLVGYESVQTLDVPLFGAVKNSSIQSCAFDKDYTLRHSGFLPHNNLSRAIYEKVPLNVDFDENDSYGYCNAKGEPIVVVPLKQIDGFLYPTWSAFGVATYNGSNGDIKIFTNEKQVAEIPGPVYAMSLASSQRNSLAASEGWWEYVVTKTSGYTAANSNTEVQLKRENNKNSDYVTTLTPRGSSKNVVAVSTVNSTTFKSGERNTLIVHKLPKEHFPKTNSSLKSDIKTLYSYLPEMSSKSLNFFEITSGKDGGWVASIGLDEAVNYRAYITADGEITLYNRDGKLIAQSGDEASESENDSPDGGITLVPTDELSGLTVEELNELGKAIMDELANRSSVSDKSPSPEKETEKAGPPSPEKETEEDSW